MGVAKWLNSATYGKPPQLAFIDPNENEDSGVSWPDAQKSLIALWKTQQEARHFAFSGHFGHIPHFYFDVLVPGFSSDRLQIEMSVITTRWR